VASAIEASVLSILTVVVSPALLEPRKPRISLSVTLSEMRSAGLTFYDATHLALAGASNDTPAMNDRELGEEARKLGIRTVAV
jgi:predicted nucleic acid-binding protein